MIENIEDKARTLSLDNGRFILPKETKQRSSKINIAILVNEDIYSITPQGISFYDERVMGVRNVKLPSKSIHTKKEKQEFIRNNDELRIALERTFFIADAYITNDGEYSISSSEENPIPVLLFLGVMETSYLWNTELELFPYDKQFGIQARFEPITPDNDRYTFTIPQEHLKYAGIDRNGDFRLLEQNGDTMLISPDNYERHLANISAEQYFRGLQPYIPNAAGFPVIGLSELGFERSLED
ncbi:hypothetical protein ACFL0W_04300 [Nanoarchaeota archaeon]